MYTWADGCERYGHVVTPDAVAVVVTQYAVRRPQLRTMASAADGIKKTVADNKVVVYSKTYW